MPDHCKRVVLTNEQIDHLHDELSENDGIGALTYYLTIENVWYGYDMPPGALSLNGGVLSLNGGTLGLR